MAACSDVGHVLVAALQEVWDEHLDPHRFARKLARLQQQGAVRVRHDPDLGAIVELTEFGRQLAAGGRDFEACLAREWDRRWRGAAFDVPESKRSLRARLRTFLKETGFGYLQQSLWISPHPIASLRASLAHQISEPRTLIFFGIEPESGTSDAAVVQASWDFRRINQLYVDYLKILRSRPRWYEGSEAWKEWIAVEWQAWIRAVRLDPLLPAALLPDDYLGRKAWAERCEVMRSVAARVLASGGS